MRRLDRTRPFGTVTPALEMPGCDRLVAFEQNGLRFDVHGRQIAPGQPLDPDEEEARAGPLE